MYLRKAINQPPRHICCSLPFFGSDDLYMVLHRYISSRFSFRGAQERMMLEMEADMPLSNAQLYAEMKKEMKGAGGAVE